MDHDRNLLFGVLALQAELIDPARFVEACTLWTARKDTSLAEMLIERGWIDAADKSHIDYLVDRKLRKHGGNGKASLASVHDDVKRSLAALDDPDIQRSLAGPPSVAMVLDATVDLPARPQTRYSLTRLHATGGIGRIWLARDADLGRDVALKELRPERADDAALWSRFLKEARITGQLEHPGVVPVYELARRPESQQPFYTMQFIKGRTLTEAAQSYHRKRKTDQADSLEFVTLLNAFVAVCNTVAYAQARGVIHRDLKGQNVVLGDFGEVVVLDWGLAKLVDRPDPDAATPTITLDSDHGSAPDLTAQGQTIGTPAYMAPEQAAGRLDLIDQRTDVYGLGAMLYEILTGQAPFIGTDTLEVLRRVREEEPPPPRNLWADVPPALEAVCLRALAKEREDRPASAGAMAQEVQRWQETERRKAEEALRSSEALYHSLVETLPLSVWRKDREGRFIFANKRFCDSLGKPLEQVIGKTDYHFFPPELAAKYRADDAGVHETGTIATTTEDHVTAAGEKLYVHVIKAPVFDAAGRVSGTQGIFWDLTEWKRAEEALRENEERYRSIIAAMQDGIVLLDRAGRVLDCNANAERILGLSADQMMGRTPHDPRWQTIHEDGSPFPGDTHPSMVTLRTGKPCRDVVMGVRKPDGSLTWISINAQPLYRADGTTLTGVVASFEDITERKRVTARPPGWRMFAGAVTPHDAARA